MRRLFILWDQPAEGSGEHARDWIAQEVKRLWDTPGVQEVELVPVGSASKRHPRWHDWLLVVKLQPRVSGDVVDRDPLFRELVADLRSLGARPIVLLEKPEMASARVSASG
jgi:hypothetical protein